MNGKKNGITLISLVITIVIMLILAAVALNLILGNNGLFKKSKDAVSIYDESKDKEDSDLKEQEKIFSLYIQDLDDLIAFRDSVNAGNTYADTTVYLVNDIDLQGSEDNPWHPIGCVDDIDYETKPVKYLYFSGNFQGNGNTISNLYIDATNKKAAGFFDYIRNGNISDLTVTGTIKKNETETYNTLNYGGISAYLSDGKIENCFTNVNMDISNKTLTEEKFEFGNVGGILGMGRNVKITNCANYGNITGNSSSIGGIIGYSYNTIVDKAGNFGNLTNKEISCKIITPNPTGGIVGENDNNCIVVNSSNHANIVQIQNLDDSGLDGTAGIVGGNYGLVYACYNEGNINGRNAVGGITGFSLYERYKDDVYPLKNIGTYYSYNTGEVSGTRNWIGGVVGYCSTSIVSCYNIGKINKGSGNDYNGIVATQTYKGTVYTQSGDEVIDLSSTGVSQIKNCYFLDSAESTNNSVRLFNSNSERINDVSYLEITKEEERYMKSKNFANDLNNDIWQYRFDNYPTLKGYSGDCTEFYNN